MAKFNGTVDNIEDNRNKVTSIRSSGYTDTAYPSEKAVRDALVNERNTSNNAYMSRNGSTPMTGNLNMGNQNITNANQISCFSMIATSNVQALSMQVGSDIVKGETYNDAKYLRVANKVTSISSSSTDNQIPSAKAVYTLVNSQTNPVITLDSDVNLWELDLGTYVTADDIAIWVNSNDYQDIPYGVAFSVTNDGSNMCATINVSAEDNGEIVSLIIALRSLSASDGEIKIWKLTDDGEATSEIATMKQVEALSGIKDINQVTLSETATNIKITKDSDNNNFECDYIEGTARLLVDTTQVSAANYVLRLRTDGGNRYIALKSMPKANCLELGFTCNFKNGVTTSQTIYQTSSSAGSTQGTSAASSVTHLNSTISTKIKDVEIFLLDGSNYVPLLAGSFLSIRGR